jgi:hypothetical protein
LLGNSSDKEQDLQTKQEKPQEEIENGDDSSTSRILDNDQDPQDDIDDSLTQDVLFSTSEDEEGTENVDAFSTSQILDNDQFLFIDSLEKSEIFDSTDTLDEWELLLAQSMILPPTNLTEEMEQFLATSSISGLTERITVTGKFTVGQLVDEFDSKWNDSTKDFENIPVDVERAATILQEHNKAFKYLCSDETVGYGTIMKQDVAPGTKIYVRADLHGDLKSLLESLKELKQQGLLDEQYRCQKDVQLVFLGDYMDRGKYGMQIAQLLAKLRLENPNQVHLIRGNHEYIDVNRIYGCQSDHFLKSFIDQEEGALSDFYSTMPLTTYLGQGGCNRKEYVQFTHGGFEIKHDPAPMLDSNEKIAYMPVPRKLELSQRIQNLKAKGKKLKHVDSAKRLEALALSDNIANRSGGARGTLTAYNWADVADHTNITSLGERKWCLSPADIKHYLRLSSTSHKVKMLFRGHQHISKDHFDDKHHVLVSTLPVGMDSPYKAHFDQQDRAYILDVAERVKDWNKRAITRDSGESKSETSNSVSIRESIA